MTETNSDRFHKGHRARMRGKLINHGNGIFENYELIEQLLYFGVSCKDTNPVAKRLLRRFGTIEGIFSADPSELASVEGVGEKCAELIRATAELYDLVGVELDAGQLRCFSSYTHAGDYFAEHFSTSKDYDVAIMLLDNGMRMLGAFNVYLGVDYGSSAVSAGKIVRCALESGACAVITAHNHPNGPLFPTPGDRSTNEAITQALGALGILHLEHFVVCGNRYIGIMNHLKERFAATAEIYEFMESREAAIAAGIVEDGALEAER